MIKEPTRVTSVRFREDVAGTAAGTSSCLIAPTGRAVESGENSRAAHPTSAAPWHDAQTGRRLLAHCDDPSGLHVALLIGSYSALQLITSRSVQQRVQRSVRHQDITQISLYGNVLQI